MSKVKNWMLDIEEFCDEYIYDGRRTFCGTVDFTIDEIVEDVDKRFQSLEAKSYAKRYLKLRVEILDEL